MTDGYRETPRGTYVCLVPECEMAAKEHEFDRCSAFRRHWRHTHERPKTSFLCAQRACPSSFPTVKACRAHMKKSHRWLGPDRLPTKQQGAEAFVDPGHLQPPPAGQQLPMMRPKTSSPALGDITLNENLCLDDTMVRARHLKREREAFNEAFEGLQCEGDPSTWSPPRKVLLEEEETNETEETKEKSQPGKSQDTEESEERIRKRLHEIQRAKQQLEDEERRLWATLVERAKTNAAADTWKAKYEGLMNALQTISKP